MYTSLPRWSPDGKQIAFDGAQYGKPWKIFLISAQGGTPQELLSENRGEFDPAWSPDGKQIAFGRLDVPEAQVSSRPADAPVFPAAGLPGHVQSPLVAGRPFSGGALQRLAEAAALRLQDAEVDQLVKRAPRRRLSHLVAGQQVSLLRQHLFE
jgi:dipeptidyl aminopeptidase/acylaminoacyl peptidase